MRKESQEPLRRRDRFLVGLLGVVMLVSPGLSLAELLSGHELQSFPVVGLVGVIALAVLARLAAGVRESERLRREVRVQNERLAESAAIVESTDDAITASTLDGTIVSWNRAAERLYGYSADEMIGQRIHKIVEPDSHARVDDDFAALAKGASIEPQEATGVRKDGTIVPVSLTVSTVRDADGVVRGVSTIARDISDRRAAEAERDALLDELAGQNERLRALDQMKDDFVASVSHELRTPLTSIRGYLELVREDGRLDEEQDRMLGIVDRNADRLLGLVADLLFMAEVDAGKLKIERHPVRIADVAAESVEAAGPRARAAEIELSLDADHDLVVSGDQRRLAQVFDNLISNAIKFTPAGGRVDVRVVRVDQDVRAEVSDTGVGIPEDDRAHLFERFFRTSGATLAAVQGTGLGLAIVGAITESHGGTVSVESGVGGGSTFVIQLPLAAREPAGIQGVAH
jgi:PAS domain S-box-containing protein